MKAEFKAGDVVRVKYAPRDKIFIIEVTRQTCYADVEQIWYTGRSFNTDKYSGGVAKEYGRFSAIELEPIPVAVPDDKMQEEIKKLKDARKRKEQFIKKQDFDRATQCREEERMHRKEIEAYGDCNDVDVSDWLV